MYCAPQQLLKKGYHCSVDYLWVHEKKVLNDIITPQKSGDWDLFSNESLMKILYNNRNQFYIFLFFVVPKNSILLKISGFHTFLQNYVLFVFFI